MDRYGLVDPILMDIKDCLKGYDLSNTESMLMFRKNTLEAIPSIPKLGRASDDNGEKVWAALPGRVSLEWMCWNTVTAECWIFTGSVGVPVKAARTMHSFDELVWMSKGDGGSRGVDPAGLKQWTVVTGDCPLRWRCRNDTTGEFKIFDGVVPVPRDTAGKLFALEELTKMSQTCARVDCQNCARVDCADFDPDPELGRFRSVDETIDEDISPAVSSMLQRALNRRAWVVVPGESALEYVCMHIITGEVRRFFGSVPVVMSKEPGLLYIFEEVVAISGTSPKMGHADDEHLEPVGGITSTRLSPEVCWMLQRGLGCRTWVTVPGESLLDYVCVHVVTAEVRRFTGLVPMQKFSFCVLHTEEEIKVESWFPELEPETAVEKMPRREFKKVDSVFSGRCFESLWNLALVVEEPVCFRPVPPQSERTWVAFAGDAPLEWVCGNILEKGTVRFIGRCPVPEGTFRSFYSFSELVHMSNGGICEPGVDPVVYAVEAMSKAKGRTVTAAEAMKEYEKKPWAVKTGRHSLEWECMNVCSGEIKSLKGSVPVPEGTDGNCYTFEELVVMSKAGKAKVWTALTGAHPLQWELFNIETGDMPVLEGSVSVPLGTAQNLYTFEELVAMSKKAA